MAGLTPDIADLPGSTFALEVTGWTATTQSNQLQIGADIAMNISLGSYNTGILQLSALVSTGNTVGADSQLNRGVGLGLNSSATGAWNSFTGLRLTPAGDLIFEENGVNKATVSVGTYSGTPQALSYSLNEATGAISNISLAGSAADFSSLIAASTVANYFGSNDYLSVFGGGSAGGQFALVDNLSISSPAAPVPEPATLSMVGVGLAGFLMLRRRRAGVQRGA